LGVISNRLQYQNLDRAANPPAFFRCFQQLLACIDSGSCILGEEWDRVRMVKRLGVNAKVNTCPGVPW
jgi:hypothetical protein